MTRGNRSTCPGRRLRSAALAVLACAAAAAIGCRGTGSAPKPVAAAPRYERIDVTYDVSGPDDGTASRALDSIRLAAGEGREGTQEPPAWRAAQLRLEYPHPETGRGRARATLRLSRTPHVQEAVEESFRERWQSLPGPQADAPADLPPRLTECDEIWQLDLPRDEVDALLRELVKEGFFDERFRPAGDSRLSVRMDGERTFKPWTTDPRLDVLMGRVYREGWLGSFVQNGRGAGR